MTRNCDNCGKEYITNTGNIARGWGLCCSRNCAATLREIKKRGGSPPKVFQFEPFNDQWRAEMMKWRKGDLVEFMRKIIFENNDLAERLKIIEDNGGALAFQMMKAQHEERSPEYLAGFDAGFNGPNEENCRFQLFATQEKTTEWERGKHAGTISKKDKAIAKHWTGGCTGPVVP